MRKIILAIITVSIFIFSANAQIKKGSIFLGGDIGGSAQNTKSGSETINKQNNINISPVAGKAIKDNLVLGVTAGFGVYKNENSNVNNNKYNNNFYNAGVFLRKYKNIGTGGFYLFIQGGLGGGYYKYKQKQELPAYNDQTKRISVGITVYPAFLMP